MKSKTPKTVLVTGCSTGLGFTIALSFARQGWLTFASMRNLNCEGSQSLLSIAKKEKLSLKTVQLDVTKQSSIDAAINEILKTSGKIDVLVNNAGVGYYGPIESFSDDEVYEQFNTNVFGVLRLIRSVTVPMRRRKSGLVINISAGIANFTVPFCGLYSSTKTTLESLTETLRYELAPSGIHVSLVVPGAYSTNFTSNIHRPATLLVEYKTRYQKFIENYYQYRQKISNSFIGKLSQPDDVSRAVLKCATSAKPKMRYFVGFDSIFYFILRRITPFSWWEFFVSRLN